MQEGDSFSVRTPDGLILSARRYGDPEAPGIVLVHGFLQSRLSWDRQVRSELAEAFRVITYDLRGHGDSDKPADPAAYADARRWADDLAAVIDQTGVRRPVLVGWSLGGLIVGQYLRFHGAEHIAGVNLVDAATCLEPEMIQPAMPGLLEGLVSPDLAVRAEAVRVFVRICFEKQPPQADYEQMLVFNGMPPRAVAQGAPLTGVEGVEQALRAFKRPALITFGVLDGSLTVAMAERTAEYMPGARLSLYPDAGHSPFYEEPARFNRELAELVREANAEAASALAGTS